MNNSFINPSVLGLRNNIVSTREDTATNGNFYLGFIKYTDGRPQIILYDSAMSYNPSTETLTVPNISVSGEGVSAKIDVTDTTTAGNYYITFVDSAGTGKTLRANVSGLRYNPSTNTLVASFLEGNGTNITNVRNVQSINVTNRTNDQEYLIGLIDNAGSYRTISTHIGGITYNPSSNNLTITGVFSSGSVITGGITCNNILSGGNISAVSFTGNGSALTSLTTANLTGLIQNNQLQNNSITIGTTPINLGSSSTTLAGLSNVTSTTFTGYSTGLSLSTFTGLKGFIFGSGSLPGGYDVFSTSPFDIGYDNTNKRLGIGTFGPQSALQVIGIKATSPSSRGIHMGEDSSNGNNSIELVNDSGDVNYIDFTKLNTDYKGRISYTHSTHNLKFSVNSDMYMNLGEQGLAIGSTNIAPDNSRELLGINSTEVGATEIAYPIFINNQSQHTQSNIGGGVGIRFGLYDYADTGNRFATIQAVSEATYSNSTALTFSTGGTAGISEKMRISNTGNVGIGSIDPGGYKLYVNGSQWAFSSTIEATATGQIGVWTNDAHGGAYNNHHYLNGVLKYYFTQTGAYVNPSDNRLKSNQKELDNILDKIMLLTPKTYTMYNVDNLVGFIAQEVYEIPELKKAVYEPCQVGDECDCECSPWSLNYQTLFVYGIKGIQELKTENDELKKEIIQLNIKYESLLSRIIKLENI